MGKTDFIQALPISSKLSGPNCQVQIVRSGLFTSQLSAQPPFQQGCHDKLANVTCQRFTRRRLLEAIRLQTPASAPDPLRPEPLPLE